ncbi:MAG: hypothetical protein ACFFCW_49255 [Candidatus Hodarchaeota archaeon]
MMNNREKAIQQLQSLLDELNAMETVGFDIEGAGNITIKGYESEGYSKAGKFKDVKNVHLEDQKHVAPNLNDIPIVRKLIETSILILHDEEKPEPKLRRIIKTIESYSGWASLASRILGILMKYGIL